MTRQGSGNCCVGYKTLIILTDQEVKDIHRRACPKCHVAVATHDPDKKFRKGRYYHGYCVK